MRNNKTKHELSDNKHTIKSKNAENREIKYFRYGMDSQANFPWTEEETCNTHKYRRIRNIKDWSDNRTDQFTVTKNQVGL